MATVNLYLDKRHANASGLYPVRLTIAHANRKLYIPTGVSVTAEQWANGKIIGHPQQRMYNSHLQSLYINARSCVMELYRQGVVDGMTVQQIRDYIMHNGNEPEPEPVTFRSVYLQFTERKRGRTRAIYETTLKRIDEFGDTSMLQLDAVDVNWLQRFDDFLAQTSPSPNARALHMRNIRAVFNDAIDRELTNNYPFRRFKIKTEATAHRALTIDQLRTLFDYPVEEYQVRWLDLFKLSFFLIGINFVDLYALDGILDGRLTYRRAKTKRLYSIKVEPETAALIEKYGGVRKMLWMADLYADYRDAMHRMNDALKKIGPVTRSGLGGTKHRRPLFPEISSYWARHTWATIAASLDIPKETISAALGHEIGSSVTSIYIDFDRDKVDDANRRVMDWVLYGKK